MKAHTSTQRALAVPDAFMVNAAHVPNPRILNENLPGLYASRETRLAMYNRVAEIARYGRTTLTDRPHCVSLDSEEEQLLLQRVAGIDLAMHALPLDVTHDFELASLLAPFAQTEGVVMAHVPTMITLRGHQEPTGDKLHLTCAMGGKHRTVWADWRASELQWIPFRFACGGHTVVVNIHSVGTYTTGQDGTTVFHFSPTVCVDLFVHLPCPQLKAKPLESDFSSLEFSAALAVAGYETIIECAEDSDWQLFALSLQDAIIQRGLPTAIVLHVCPSQSKRVPDMWVDMRAVVGRAALRSALLWYLIGHHDFGAGIQSVGAVAQLKAIEDFAHSGRPLPIRANPVAPSKIVIDVAACLAFARSTLKPNKALEDHIVDGAKQRISTAVFLKAALHPVRTMAAAFWPLD
jgi:hypothetical protein